MATLVALVIVLIVIGVILYLINAFIPMDPKFKQLINIVVIAGVAIWIIVKFLLPLLKNVAP